MRRPSALLPSLPPTFAAWSVPARCLRVAAAVAALSLASRTWLPFFGTLVPFTLQGQMVFAVGATLGAAEGPAAVLAWLACAAAGLPVLSGEVGSGLALVGPTAGYLWSYPALAYFVGRFGRGTHAVAYAVWLVANVALLVAGTSVLALFVGGRVAIATGFVPFVLGDLAKLTGLFVARQLHRSSHRQ